jgi:hypothetical protein
VNELRLLQQPDFLESVREAGFTLAAPDQLIQGRISDAQAA